MKLNVGCGRFRRDGWHNLDHDPRWITDTIADLRDLPPHITGVTAVYLGHILHLIPAGEALAACHKLWQRCVPGAQVAAVGPDALRLLDQKIPNPEEHLGGDDRQWTCDQRRLVDMLRGSGLQLVRPVLLTDPDLEPFPVVSQVSWQCAVRGQVGAIPQGVR